MKLSTSLSAALLLLGTLGGSWAYAADAQTPDKIGFLNIGMILSQSKHAGEFVNQYKAQDDKEAKAIDQMHANLESQSAQLEKNADTLSPEALRTKRKELATMYQSMSDRADKFDNLRASRKQDYVLRMRQLIQAAVEKVVKEQHYTMILQMEALVYFDDKRDLTEEILKDVDAHPLPSSSEASPKASKGVSQ